MSVPFDPQGDFAAVADGTEPVVLLRRGATPGSPGVEISHALRRAMTAREAAESDGRHTATDAVWHLPVAELGAAPRLGDLVVDAAGSRWSVLQVQLVALRTRWRCIARSLAIVHGLDDAVTIQRAVYAKGAGGAARPAFRTWRTGVRARIQPLESVPVTAQGVRRTAERFRIVLEKDLALDHRHRILAADGAAFDVVRVARAERVGELLTIEAERVS